MPVKLVPSVKSEPRTNPNVKLNTPATDIIAVLSVLDFEDIVNGIDMTTVIKAIDTIVPNAKKNKNTNPEKKFAVVGSIAAITTALPANP
jgi:hypothetical protein